MSRVCLGYVHSWYSVQFTDNSQQFNNITLPPLHLQLVALLPDGANMQYLIVGNREQYYYPCVVGNLA